MTYDEMSEAHRIAKTEEEKKILLEKIEIFEKNAEKAQIYFEDRSACIGGEFAWFCDGVRTSRVEHFETLDGLVKAYKREYQSCGCYKASDVMRELRRAFGSY